MAEENENQQDQGAAELQAAQARAEQAEREAAGLKRQLFINEVAAKHNIPAELHEMLNRSDWTNEEIEKQAERLATVAKAPVTTAAEVYGGSTVGGGTPVRTSKDADGEWMSNFESRWNNREQMSPQEYQRYAALKLGRHTYRAMKEVGKQHLWGPLAAPDFERY